MKALELGIRARLQKAPTATGQNESDGEVGIDGERDGGTGTREDGKTGHRTETGDGEMEGWRDGGIEVRRDGESGGWRDRGMVGRIAGGTERRGEKQRVAQITLACNRRKRTTATTARASACAAVKRQDKQGNREYRLVGGFQATTRLRLIMVTGQRRQESGNRGLSRVAVC